MQLHEYQRVAKDFVVQRFVDTPAETQTGVGLLLDLGLGKTIVTLQAIRELKEKGLANRVLIVGPLRVVYGGWQNEAAKWGLDYSFSLLHGAKKDKALATEADIHLINTDGVYWLAQQKYNYDLVVVDEISLFRNWSSRRTKSLRRIVQHTPRVIGLTGTPVPNDLGDIFSPQFMLDRGATLGTSLTRFRDRFMKRCGYELREWEMVQDLIPVLQRLISPWWLHQSAVDHLDMPELVHNEVIVQLPKQAMTAYKSMEKEMLLELEEASLVAMSGGGKYNLCRQLASGGAYLPDKSTIGLHDAKLDALSEILESLTGKSLFIGYNFNHELERIRAKFPRMPAIHGRVSAAESKELLDKFRSGAIKVLAAQVQAVSHGIDGLQRVCNDVCFFSPTDQPDVREQFIGRIHRQGAKQRVVVHHLLADKTVDLTIKRTLDQKHANQRAVLEAIKQHRANDATR